MMSIRYSIHRKLVDLEFVASVKFSLADGEVLNMSDLNKKYICMLIEHGIPETSENNKKYVKDLLTKCIENINFILPPRRNESENLLLNETVSGAIDSFVDQYSNWDSDLIRITKMMRKELLDTRKKWKFSGKLNENIRNPPIIDFFLQQLLFGAHTLDVNGKRVIQVQQTVDMAIQILMQNVRTDRQMKYSSKTDAGFVQKSQTSLSIGLPLTIHNRFRDKSLVSLLSDMHIGSLNKTIMDIEKRVETAIVHEMSVTGSYCLPDFIKNDVTLYFATDNIDFQEDTAYSQNTLHRTILVVNQRQNEFAESLRGPLKIPENLLW